MKGGKKKAGGFKTTAYKRPALKTPLQEFTEGVTRPSSMLRLNVEVFLEHVEGSIWCDVHGCIHEDTADPYDSGYKERGETPACGPLEWRNLYMPPMGA